VFGRAAVIRSEGLISRYGKREPGRKRGAAIDSVVFPKYLYRLPYARGS
jgi:hypothetical protein